MPQSSRNAVLMPIGFSPLLVHDQDEPMGSVERIFLAHGVRPRRSRNCEQAGAVLRGLTSPNIVVTDLNLPDGNWTDILRAADVAPTNPRVIVVSRHLDIRLYLDVLDSGAHDFVVPPFSASELAYIIKTALPTDRPLASGSPFGREPSTGRVITPRCAQTVLKVASPFQCIGRESHEPRNSWSASGSHEDTALSPGRSAP